MNNLESFGIPSYKKGSGIHIKKKNRGKFTKYCNGKVTQKCIDKAKKSRNKTLVKRATFAENARAWKHLEGGPIRFNDYGDFNKYLSTTTGGYVDVDSKDFSESKLLMPLLLYNPRSVLNVRPREVYSGFNHLIKWYSNPRRLAILKYNKLEGQAQVNEALNNIQKYSKQTESIKISDDTGSYEKTPENVANSLRNLLNDKILPTQLSKLENSNKINKELKTKLQHLHSILLGIGNGYSGADWDINFNNPEKIAENQKSPLYKLAKTTFSPKIEEDGNSYITQGYYFKGGHGLPEHIAFRNSLLAKDYASHEGAHALGLEEVENVAGNIVQNTSNYDSMFKFDPYLDSGSEVLARLTTVREKNKIDPNHVYTLEEIKKLKETNNGDDEILSRYPAEILLQLFNRVAKNDSFVVPEPMKNINPNDGINYAKKGTKVLLKHNNHKSNRSSSTKELKKKHSYVSINLDGGYLIEKIPDWLIPKKFDDAKFVEKIMRRSNGGNWRNLFGIAGINTGSRKAGEHTPGPLGLVDRPTPDRNRDLVSLYMRETSLLVPYKNPTPIFVNGQELTGDLYEGKIFMGDSMILPMHMQQIVEDYVNNGKIMSMETNTPIEDSWYEYNNKGKTYDNTRAHYISLKKGDDGKYYADIFDRWDMDHNLLGRTLESKHGKPFILRLKVPVHFSEEYDYNTMSYLLNLHEKFLQPSNSWEFKKELNRNFNIKKLSKKEQDKADWYGYELRETIN